MDLTSESVNRLDESAVNKKLITNSKTTHKSRSKTN
jgi:hypothetical protein